MPELFSDIPHGKAKLFLQGAGFWLRAGNAHSIHSPFLFHLYNDVIRAETDPGAVNMLKHYRRLVADDKTLLKYQTAGSAASVPRSVKPSGVMKREASVLKDSKLLYRLVRYFKPEYMLELGTNLGVGTFSLHAGHPEARLITVDAVRELSDKAGLLLNKMATKYPQIRPQQVDYRNGLFNDCLPQILKEVPRLDLVFFDGHHHEHPTKEYFNACLARAHPSTLFVFDDIHWSAGMNNAWKYIRSHEKVTQSVDLFHIGLVFFREELSRQFFELRY